MAKRIFYILICLASSIVLIGCTSQVASPRPPSLPPTNTPQPSITALPMTVKPTGTSVVDEENKPLSTRWGLTYQRLDGNRLVPGTGSIPNTNPIDIPLHGKPVWLVGVAYGAGQYWAAVLEDGAVEAFRLTGDEVTPITIMPERLPPGMPPFLSIDGDKPYLLSLPSGEFSNFTHPVRLPSSQNIAAIADNGDLILLDSQLQELDRLALDALPDARLLVDENDRILLLANPTGAYDHGVLGDAIEATSIKLVGSSPRLEIIQQITLPQGMVIEGLAPIWTDLDGDGAREIVVTASSFEQGAQVQVYNETGELLANGPPTGQPYRWRHQIAAAPFGPQKEVELVEVLTPHLGGLTSFYRLDGADLTLVGQVSGCTSHVLGSRNLDMATAGDFDGDGRVEVLLLTQDLRQLCAVRRTPAGAEIAWTVAAGGIVSTNLATITDSGGSITVGVGLAQGSARIWSPKPQNSDDPHR